MKTINSYFCFSKSTLLGFVAIFIWSFQPLLLSEICHIPIFQLLFIIFFSSFLATSIKLTITKKWRTVKQPLAVYIIGVLGACGSDIAYVYGAKFAPVSHIDFIDYLWPCFTIVLTAIFPSERLSWRSLAGAGCAILGAYPLIITASKVSYPQFWIGYLLALLGAILWGGYSALSRLLKNTPSDMLGIYGGFAAILVFSCHVKFEQWKTLSAMEWIFAIFIGVFSFGLANQLWDRGVKTGNIQLLSVLTYPSRILGVLLLVVFDKEPMSFNLLVACLLTSLGLFISQMKITTIKPSILKSKTQ